MEHPESEQNAAEPGKSIPAGLEGENRKPDAEGGSGELVPLEEIEVRQFVDTTVVGRRPPLFGCLLGLLFFGVLGLSVLMGDSNFLTYGILLLFAWGGMLQLRLLLRPPRMAIADGSFQLRFHRTCTTAAENVADVRLNDGRPAVCFHSIEDVNPPGMRDLLRKQFDKHGAHLQLTAPVFSPQQINQIRKGLGFPPQQVDVSAREAENFEEQLQRTTHRVVIMPTLVTLNLLMFGVIAFAGGGVVIPDVGVMINFGANFGRLTAHGDAWRLVTSLFLHFGVIHLLFNMWILRDIGTLVERLVGNAGFLVGYLLSGAVGAVASVVWHRGEVVSAGASGAIFGVYGMLLGFLVLRRSSIPIRIVKEHRRFATAFVVFNLLIGLSVTWIDNAAHLGGLIAGFFCGLALSRELTPTKLLPQVVRSGLLATAGVAVVGVALHLASVPAPQAMEPQESPATQQSGEVETAGVFHSGTASIASGHGTTTGGIRGSFPFPEIPV